MSRFWKQIWQRPDARHVQAGYETELPMAGVRLLVVVLLVYVPADRYLGVGFGAGGVGGDRDPRVLLTAAVAALVGALLIYSAVQRHWGRSWISFASSLLDVTLVSGVLALFLVLGQPRQAVADVAIFPAYFLAIMATSLRYDARVCLLTGSLAVAEYAAIVAAAWLSWLAAEPFAWADQVARLVALGVATALAVWVVVRARELRSLSSRDRFTGLLNRATFDERLRVEEPIALATGHGFAVGMIDIDHFKRFNDTHGHAGGDVALKQVAEVLRGAFREADVVARYGGEEFSVLLVGIGPEHTMPLFERIRRTIGELAVSVPDRDEPASVTVSIGVAVFPVDGTGAGEVLATADRRLYEAKAAGRNRVVGPVVAYDVPRPRASVSSAPSVQ
jgi:diguanylate cyclase (GGDEF)-like protein